LTVQDRTAARAKGPRQTDEIEALEGMMKRLLTKRTVLGAMVLVLSLGWVGTSEAGGRGHHKHRGHHGRHGYYYGHHGGHGYYYGHHDHDDYYYGALIAYGVPLLLGALDGLHSPAHAAPQAPATGYVQQQTGYWYYCTDPAGYYPYIKSCPQGWMQVVPSGPPGRP
jgi:hypothetical protein